MTKTKQQLEKEIRSWRTIAEQHARNTEYYRTLIIQIGKMFGKKARTTDDGKVHRNVLCAKVPELVKNLILDYFIMSGDK